MSKRRQSCVCPTHACPSRRQASGTYLYKDGYQLQHPDHALNLQRSNHNSAAVRLSYFAGVSRQPVLGCRRAALQHGTCSCCALAIRMGGGHS